MSTPNFWTRCARKVLSGCRVNGEMRSLDEKIAIWTRKKKHTIEVVVDRLVVKSGITRRLTDSVELALRTSEGQVLMDVEDQGEMFFSERFACDNCGISYPELTPQLFSFNSPQGACPGCDGLGVHDVFRPGTDRAQPRTVAKGGGGGALGPFQFGLLYPDAGIPGRTLQFRHFCSVQRLCRPRPGRSFCTVRMGMKYVSFLKKRIAAISTIAPLKALSPTWSGVTARRIPRRCGRTLRNT